ncbi:MAG: hypothetical protein WAV72_09330, partial [Bradyrhizobium sp.]
TGMGRGHANQARPPSTMRTLKGLCGIKIGFQRCIGAFLSIQNSIKLNADSRATPSRTHLGSELMMKLTAVIEVMEAATPIRAPNAAPF